MKWNEMTTVQKSLHVIELISGLLFWTFFILLSFDILEAKVAVVFLLLVNTVCRYFTARTKVLKIIWSIFVVIECLLFVVSLLLYLR